MLRAEELDKSQKPLSKWVPRNLKLFLVSITLLSTVHPTTMGYDSMMIGSILNLDSYVNFFNLTSVTTGLNTAAAWMGQIIGCLTVVQYCNDKFGRKVAILLGLIVVTVGVVLQSAAQNSAMFIIGRIIIGMGVILTNISAIVLLAELCPANLRGFLMGLAFSCFLVGSLISSGITYGFRNLQGNWNWRAPSLFQLVPSLVALINWVFLPESPKYLINKGYTKQAYEILLLVCKGSEVKAQTLLEEYEEEELQNKLEDFHPWSQFLTSRINMHKAFINLTHSFITEMGGSSVGSYYLAILLMQAGILSSTERLQVNIVMSAWQLICACTGCYLFDKMGRKRQAMVSLTGMIVCFFILGGFVKKYGDGHSKGGSYGTIVFMFLFSGFYSSTYTPMNTLYPPELYPYKMRGTGTTLYNIMSSSFGLLSSFILPIAMESIGWKYYIVNAAYDIILLPIIYYFWIETKQCDIERIDELFWDHPYHKNYVPTSDSVEGSVEHISMEIQNKV